MTRFALATAATLASGALYALAFPPHRLHAIAFLALAPFFVALRVVGPRTALFLAWLWPIGASVFVADALPAAVETYFLQPPLVAHAFAIGVWTVTGSLYAIAFALLYRSAARAGGIATPLLGGAAWAASELLRGRLFTDSGFFVGNPWALLAYSQAERETLRQVASLGGPYAISFVVACAGAGLAELALRRRRAVTACALSVAPLALALGWGALVLRGAARELPGQAPVEIATVQGDVDLGSVWRSDFYGRNLDVYLQQTLDVAARGAPAVVFWPEAALTFFLDEEPLYRDAITRVLANEDLELVVGGPAKANAAGDRFWNSAFLLDATGATRARYDKQHLVPFSEFFPLARLDFLRRRFERVRVFEHGGDPAVLLPSRAGAIGVLTCNEAMLPEVAARRVAAGAQLLASPSNDSWIRSEKWAAIMFDMVALRAVETRRWLVRASTSGPSAIVDPWGRAVVRTAPFTRDVVLGRVAARDDRTVYVWIGDSFGVACGLVALAAAVAGARRPSV